MRGVEVAAVDPADGAGGGGYGSSILAACCGRQMVAVIDVAACREPLPIGRRSPSWSSCSTFWRLPVGRLPMIPDDAGRGSAADGGTDE